MKNLTILFWLLLWPVFSLTAQYCEIGTYILTTQAGVDSFKINFPDCTAIDGPLVLRGNGINNLAGLQHLERTDWGLVIENTNLTNLQGLENFQATRAGIYINGNALLTSLSGLENLILSGLLELKNNPVLESLDGLQKMKLSPLPIYTLNIQNCPMLSDCALANFCNYLSNYGLHTIANNGLGCSTREEIVADCGIVVDTSNQLSCYQDGFEDWELVDNYELPKNWLGEVKTSPTGELNLERVAALTEGTEALVLRSNAVYAGENQVAELDLLLEDKSDLIDIQFTYRCLGEGFCVLQLREGTDMTLELFRPVWVAVAGDTTQRTVYLSDIRVRESGHFFTYLNLLVYPGQLHPPSGISEFFIDDLSISKPAQINAVPSIELTDIKCYPNPTTDYVYFDHNAQLAFTNIGIYDSYGTLVKAVAFSDNLDISDLASGMYWIELTNAKKQLLAKRIRIVKI